MQQKAMASRNLCVHPPQLPAPKKSNTGYDLEKASKQNNKVRKQTI